MTSNIRRKSEQGVDSDLRPYAEVFADVEYLATEYDCLRDRYPDQWVAIFEQDVVATATSLEDLTRLLSSLGLTGRSPITEYFHSRPQVRV